MRIWKFPIPTGSKVKIRMPKGATVLHVGEQNGYLMLWAIWEKKELEIEKCEDREFEIHGTDSEIEMHGLGYLGTVQTGVYVWHVFERRS